MEFREPASDDSSRIREIVESAMTSSFQLSPQQIDGVVETEFGDARLADATADSDAVVVVAESETEGESSAVVGFLWGSVEDEWGEVVWLFVDPEHRGQGVGTRLFETGVERLRASGAERLRAYVLKAGGDGHQFCEQFGFEQTDDRQVDVGDETLVQFVYARPTEDESG